MDELINQHKEKVERIYRNTKYLTAIDIWASYFAHNEDQIQYSNWRYTNNKRKKLENKLFKKFIKSGYKILDIGCGSGFFLKRIYESFNDTIKYFGIDISKEAINLAMNYFNKAKYFVSPGEKLPFENNSFDYIQIISTLWHVSDQEKVLKEVYRVLKKEGYLYIVIHKKSIDAFLLIEIFNKLNWIKKKKKINTNRKKVIEFIHTLSLKNLRSVVDKLTDELGLHLIDKKVFLTYINIPFYRKLKVPFSVLIKIADFLNYLPFTFYKNLEYRVYKK